MMRNLAWVVTVFLLASLRPDFALAHKPSDSYLSLRTQASSISGQWDISLRDLEYAIGLDADGDGQITWGELKAKHAEIAAYAVSRLAFSADGTVCPLLAGEQRVDNHSDGAYTVLYFTAECGREIHRLEARYNLFFDFDTQHKGLLKLDSPQGTRTGVFAADRPVQQFTLAELSLWSEFTTFIREGVWHIWIGFDHILFILSLLLPAVLVYREKQWIAAAKPMPVFWDVFKVVTSFTVAHSITLSLAALEVISLPTRLVESSIAASVVLAAVNNLYPMVQGRRWLVAFVFGLIHGFGFASVLADLGLPQNALLLALVGFNLGVEAGQLCIVGAFLPLAYYLRNTGFYRVGVMGGGSALVCVIATIWFIERAFDVKILAL
ncbi:MAG: HupE/UreJ family protein [Burkholderiales bacterium]